MKPLTPPAYVPTRGDDFWIGIFDSDTAEESQAMAGYSWAHSCATLDTTWTNWKSGDPQNTADNFCGAMFKDYTEWRSGNCEDERPFLCGKRTGEKPGGQAS